MTIINGTLVKMQDGEEIFIHHPINEINKAIDQAISYKRNFITIDHLGERDIYFNYIRDKRPQKRDIPEKKENLDSLSFLGSNEKRKLLEGNSKAYNEAMKKDAERRKKQAEVMRDIVGITFEKRKKSFLEKREEILKALAKEEEFFLLETTISKLKDLNELRLKNQKNEINKN